MKQRIGPRYLLLAIATVLLMFLLIPFIFLLELQMVPHFPTTLATSIQVSLGDALTMASVMGAVGVFILERYWSALRNEREKLYGGALRLILKQIRDQKDLQTIEEHWRIFIQDIEGRRSYCKGEFERISLDEFTAQILTLRMEGQIDITQGNQVVYRVPYDVRARKLDQNEKQKVIEVLAVLAQSGEDAYIRGDALETMSSLRDASVVEVVKNYLDDSSQRVQLEAARALIKLVSFAED